MDFYDIALKVQTQIDNNKARADFRRNSRDAGSYSNNANASISIIVPTIVIVVGPIAIACLWML